MIKVYLVITFADCCDRTIPYSIIWTHLGFSCIELQMLDCTTIKTALLADVVACVSVQTRASVCIQVDNSCFCSLYRLVFQDSVLSPRLPQVGSTQHQTHSVHCFTVLPPLILWIFDLIWKMFFLFCFVFKLFWKSQLLWIFLCISTNSEIVGEGFCLFVCVLNY